MEGCGFDCRLQSLHSVDTGDADADRLQTTRLHVGGMTCGACSGSVERGLLELPGVSHAAVSLTQVRRQARDNRPGQYTGGKRQQQQSREAVVGAGTVFQVQPLWRSLSPPPPAPTQLLLCWLSPPLTSTDRHHLHFPVLV